MAVREIHGVKVVHWNPRSKRLPFPFRRFRFGARIDNFGDILGPALVSHLIKSVAKKDNSHCGNGTRLLTIGSILPLARTGDVIWGAGMNGKENRESLKFSDLDVRSVRGPITAEILSDMGIKVPVVYGDPALLVGEMFPELLTRDRYRSFAFVPNFHELSAAGSCKNVISPLGDPLDVIGDIASCRGIASSSLHGIVVAEALGIPAVLVRPKREDALKYRDYYSGTGRAEYPVAASPGDAEGMLASGEVAPPALFDKSLLIESFPCDLWGLKYV